MFNKKKAKKRNALSKSVNKRIRRIRIYQIEPLDTEYVFRSYARLADRGLDAPPSELYKVVYDGYLGTEDLEKIFQIFNMEHPMGYCGRSLSMSDIVELYDDDGSDFYYCDTFGFEKLPFTPIKEEMADTEEHTLFFRLHSTDFPVTINVSNYSNNSNLAVMLISAAEDECGEPFTDVTKNLDEIMPYYCGAVKTYSENQGMLDFLHNNGLGEPTGKIITSGFVEMPIIQFNSERLRALDPSGCKRYEHNYNKKHKK